MKVQLEDLSRSRAVAGDDEIDDVEVELFRENNYCFLYESCKKAREDILAVHHSVDVWLEDQREETLLLELDDELVARSSSAEEQEAKIEVEKPRLELDVEEGEEVVDDRHLVVEVGSIEGRREREELASISQSFRFLPSSWSTLKQHNQ